VEPLRRGYRYGLVLVPVVAVRGVPVPAVHVIGVVAVLDGDVPTAGTVAVRVREMSQMVRGALRASPDEDDLMAAHGEPGVGLNASLGVVDHAVADLRDPAAGLAANVLVVTALLLIARDPVPEVEALDDACLLERGH
jgi:hypothetical protein